jgi:DNA-binding Lrp family transcriptional regulator
MNYYFNGGVLMDKNLTNQEKQIIRVLQEGLPLDDRPYQSLADKLGMSEEDLLAKIISFQERGLIRRFGATVRQRAVGVSANAMVVWNVPEAQADLAGSTLAGFPQVTHCYRRPRRPDWPYNLFTMIHGTSREYCQEIAQKMAESTGLTDYALLYSTRELKKSSLRYFK